ncbi:hypothetical protein ACFE04_010814 [Oxalis oulophora]
MRAFLLLLFTCVLINDVYAIDKNSQSCETTSPDALGYVCSNVGNGSENHQCQTFAILRTNSYFSSLSNLSTYLGLNRFTISEANGFSADQTEFLPNGQLLLIPIDCKCKGGVFQGDLVKTAVKGESFYEIAESLEGLTTCKAIENDNPGVSQGNLNDKVRLLVPLKCACPEVVSKTKMVISYPVIQGDTISNLAAKFNITKEEIIYENKRFSQDFLPERLVPLTSVLIPFYGKPSLHIPGINNITPIDHNHHHHHKKKLKMETYIVLSGVFVVLIIAIAGILLVIIHIKKKKQMPPFKARDLELQQLSLSTRTVTSEKKISFAVSQSSIDHSSINLVENYTIEELKNSSENFNSGNQIEGSVYHGRLKGKNLAIKRIDSDTISKIETELFHNSTHHHSNILRLLGTCLTDGTPDSYLVFEYAVNGSLKDWLHGGLAIKNQFIASCDCFLTWRQRLKICLDVALALQYMHDFITPIYIHRNVKSRNIFLDEDFNAKIGNFGLANCVQENPAYWDICYLAPENLHQGVISQSIDIFAYGIVLLEVLTGQKPNVGLAEKIKAVLESDNADDDLKVWMDPVLGDNYSFDEALSVASLARACIEEDPGLRPNAGEVVEKLSKLVEELAVVGGEHFVGFSERESCSKPLVKIVEH